MEVKDAQEIEKGEKKGIEILQILLTVVVIAIVELIYFKDALRGDKLFGQSFDSGLVNLILEHWYDVVCGRGNVLDLRMFWPQSGTLGYSEALLGPGIIYSIFRIFGFDFFAAFNPAFIAVHLLGTVFMYLSLRKLGCTRIISLVGLGITFWSCSFSQLSWHAQFFSLSGVPILIYIFLCFLEKRSEPLGKRCLYYIAFTVMTGITFFSSVYVAYVLTLYVLLTFVAFLIYVTAKDKSIVRVSTVIKEKYGDILLFLFLQLFWVIPFLIVYLPVYKSFGGYDDEFALALAPTVTDFFRTRSYAPLENTINQILMQGLPTEITDYEMHMILEKSYGWPILATMLFFASILFSLFTLKKEKKTGCIMSVIASVVLLGMFLLFCRYGEFCPWLIVSRIIPGAGAIRALGRPLAIFTVPMSIVVCWFLMQIYSVLKKNKYYYTFSMGILFSLLCFSNQCARFIERDGEYQRNVMQNVSQPPEDCKVMFICSANTEAFYDYGTQILGCLIADHFKLDTVNGYSGNFPNEWYLFNDQNGYYTAIDYWLEVKGIESVEGIYGFVAEENRWVSYTEIAESSAVPQ